MIAYRIYYGIKGLHLLIKGHYRTEKFSLADTSAVRTWNRVLTKHISPKREGHEIVFLRTLNTLSTWIQTKVNPCLKDSRWAKTCQSWRVRWYDLKVPVSHFTGYNGICHQDWTCLTLLSCSWIAPNGCLCWFKLFVTFSLMPFQERAPKALIVSLGYNKVNHLDSAIVLLP